MAKTANILPANVRKWLTLQNIAVVALSVIALYLLVQFMRKQKRVLASSVNLGITALNDQQKAKIQALTARAYQWFVEDWGWTWADGWFSSSWDSEQGEVLRDMMDLTDDELKAMNNAYATTYQRSLRKDIEDLWASVSKSDRVAVLQRMTNLGITQ